jgi:histone H3/H4
MAKKKAAAKGKGGGDAMIISKTRVKAAVKKCNVGSEFYGALEGAVRGMIARAEERALGNKRKTLRAADV